MRWKEDNGLKWLEFEVFDGFPNLVHGVFSRHGGVSVSPFDTLNLGEGLGDREEDVEKNRQRVAGQLGLPRLVYAKQVHKTQIVRIDAASPQEIADCDGLVTTKPQIALMIKHADCQAAIFYDPTRHVVATIHAGWRGLVQNIYAVTVRRLREEYDVHPENLLVGIAPSLGPAAAEFTNYREEFPEPFWEHQPEPNYFDLWEIGERQLHECGVLPDHIEIARLSTYSHPEDFFSYRREEKTGRHGTLAALR